MKSESMPTITPSVGRSSMPIWLFDEINMAHLLIRDCDFITKTVFKMYFFAWSNSLKSDEILRLTRLANSLIHAHYNHYLSQPNGHVLGCVVNPVNRYLA